MRSLRTALLLAAFPALAHAQQQTIDKRFALNPDGVVRIFNFIGSIKVIGWDRDSVTLTGTAAAGLGVFGGGPREGVKLMVTGEQTSRAQAADLIVHLPARARITIKTASADVDVSAIAGEVQVDATTGRIRIQGTPHGVDAETIGGDLEVIASPAHLRGRTGTGRITWTGSSEDAGLVTVSGRIEINGGTVTRGRFESIDGNIRFTGGVTKSAEVVFDTHGGDVVLVLARDTEAQIEVYAPSGDLFGKRINMDTLHLALARHDASYAQAGKTGPASPTITVRSFKGRVTVSLQ
jgi:hypothetical protein